MDRQTKLHFDAWCKRHVRADDLAIIDYMRAVFDTDPEYWSDRGWERVHTEALYLILKEEENH